MCDDMSPPKDEIVHSINLQYSVKKRAKEKLNLFMKGQDADLDEIYDKFGVDYNLLSLLMRREADSEGKLRIRWGEQNIA